MEWRGAAGGPVREEARVATNEQPTGSGGGEECAMTISVAANFTWTCMHMEMKMEMRMGMEMETPHAHDAT